MKKRPERRGQVLFINAVNEVERKNAQSFLEEKHIQKIAKAYDKYETDSDFTRVVTIQDIEENNFSLSIPLYVKHPGQDTEVDERSLQERYEDWRTVSEIMKLRYMKLNEMIGREVEGHE
jgi:type I restriction enzyme M protein